MVSRRGAKAQRKYLGYASLKFLRASAALRVIVLCVSIYTVPLREKILLFTQFPFVRHKASTLAYLYEPEYP